MLQHKAPITKATPEQAGCWLEGSRGHYIGAHAIMRAWDYGMPHTEDDEKIVKAYREDAWGLLSDGKIVQGQQDAGEYLNGLDGMVEVATMWLTDNVAPPGFYFVWTDCELFMTECSHTWVAGMMIVHREDLESVVAARDVECDNCDVEIRKGSNVPERYIYPGE